MRRYLAYGPDEEGHLLDYASVRGVGWTRGGQTEIRRAEWRRRISYFQSWAVLSVWNKRKEMGQPHQGVVDESCYDWHDCDRMRGTEKKLCVRRGVLSSASSGSPGHGAIHLLVYSFPEIGFAWTLNKRGGLPLAFRLCA